MQEVPYALSDIVMSCLEKSTGLRYSSADQLRKDLEAVRDNTKVSFSREKIEKEQKVAALKSGLATITATEVKGMLMAGAFIGFVIGTIVFVSTTPSNQNKPPDPMRIAIGRMCGIVDQCREGEQARSTSVRIQSRAQVWQSRRRECCAL